MHRKINHSLELLAECIKKYPKIAVASSFGKDSIVILHLAQQIKPDIQVFSIMTPFKFQETFDYKKKICKEWRLNIRTYMADGDEQLFHEDPEICCDYYKVEQTRRAISELKLDAWICGLRNTEGHTRKFTEEVQDKYGFKKINPILTWTEAEVWLYHAINNIPVHPLYKQGYRSLGCEPCSNPNSVTERGGRWANTDKCGGECGIHTKTLREEVANRDKGKF